MPRSIKIVAHRMADPTLVVPSPIDGRITAAQRGAGAVRAAGQPAGALYRGRYQHDVDAGECGGGRQPGVPRRTAGEGQAQRVSRSRVRRQDHHDRRDGRPEHASRSGSLGDQAIRSTNCVRACSAISPSALARRSVPLPFRSLAWCAKATARKPSGSPPTAAGSRGGRSRSASRARATGKFSRACKLGELVATEGAIFLSNMVTIAAASMKMLRRPHAEIEASRAERPSSHSASHGARSSCSACWFSSPLGLSPSPS